MILGTGCWWVPSPLAASANPVCPATRRNVADLSVGGIASTGFSAAESGGVRLGDAVAVFAQGPIGLCATLGARLMGAAQIFAVDPDPFRLQMARRFGATRTIDSNDNPVEVIRQATRGRGVDVAIEALGMRETFENALRTLKPAGTLSSVGVYSSHLNIPIQPFGAGLADQRIISTLCPGGKERMLRLMRLVQAGRIDLKPLITHPFTLDQIGEAYTLFANRRDNVLKVAIHVNETCSDSASRAAVRNDAASM